MEITAIAVVSFAIEKSVTFSTVHRATIAYWFALVKSVVAPAVGSWTDAEPVRKLLAIATLCEVQKRQGFGSGLAVLEHVVERRRL